MIWPTAIRLADEVRRLRRENRELTYRLVHAQHETEQVRASLRVAVGRQRQAERDATLLGLMARDRKVAFDFIQTAHDIDEQETA